MGASEASAQAPAAQRIMGGSEVDLQLIRVVKDLQVLAAVTRVVPEQGVIVTVVLAGHTIAVLTRVMITGM
jgi:hypothetical protein